MGSLGNMTLIDTPGLNDPDAARTDKKIYIEMIKNITELLYDKEQGISSLTLCAMLNASRRVTDATIKAMISIFFMFNSLDERIDIIHHPKYHVIINDVSNNEEKQDVKNYLISRFKEELKNEAIKTFIQGDISDESKVG